MGESTDTYLVVAVIASIMGVIVCCGIKLLIDYMRVNTPVYLEID